MHMHKGSYVWILKWEKKKRIIGGKEENKKDKSKKNREYIYVKYCTCLFFSIKFGNWNLCYL